MSDQTLPHDAGVDDANLDDAVLDDATVQDVDATGQPRGMEQVNAPQQVPMTDDAAGGGDTLDDDVDATSTEDLSVQGGDA